MATAAMAYGERRFEAAYTARILLTLGALGAVMALWATQNKATPAPPALLWISIALMFAVAGLWIALGKTVLMVCGLRWVKPF